VGGRASEMDGCMDGWKRARRALPTRPLSPRTSRPPSQPHTPPTPAGVKGICLWGKGRQRESKPRRVVAGGSPAGAHITVFCLVKMASCPPARLCARVRTARTAGTDPSGVALSAASPGDFRPVGALLWKRQTLPRAHSRQRPRVGGRARAPPRWPFTLRPLPFVCVWRWMADDLGGDCCGVGVWGGEERA